MQAVLFLLIKSVSENRLSPNSARTWLNRVLCIQLLTPNANTVTPEAVSLEVD